MSPSRTASLAIFVPTRSPSCEISKSQKSERDTACHSTRAAPLSTAQKLQGAKADRRAFWVRHADTYPQAETPRLRVRTMRQYGVRPTFSQLVVPLRRSSRCLVSSELVSLR
eukprot:scaffold64142_cov43-Phaeocystis_antarctica.AAC.1